MTTADPQEASAKRRQSRPGASIIIPVHNKATITRQCLDALLAESDDGIDREIVVVDDGSADTTPTVLTGYGDRIRVIRHDLAVGFAGACNAGVASATGEFLVLLNNDTVPTTGWLSALVAYAEQHPMAAVVGAKLLFPNDTIQHAGVAIGLDALPHHIYAGFPAEHPATSVSRPFQVVTAACALFRRGPWQELGGLDTAFLNGWEDVDYCLRAGEADYEIHYCAESVVYHFESATRNLVSDAERANQELFGRRWRHKVAPDDYRYYWQDGLLSAQYGARYPIRLSVSPQLAGVTVGESERLADKLLYDRARQVMILLRNNIVLNVRVQEAEARAAEAERQLAEILKRDMAGSTPGSDGTPTGDDAAMSADEPGDAATTESAPSQEPAEDQRAALPHRIVGMVESPGRIPEVITDGVLTVSGWTLTEAGDATIEVFVNGVSRGVVPYGDSRPDAAALYPGFPAGANCGFLGEIAVGELPDGMHEASIRISASDGALAELTTSFEVDNHAFETGRVIGRLDQPHRGAIFIPRETIVVSGWVLAPSGIERIEAFVDGEARGRIDHRVLRPDIAKRRRQYADADHCGFSGTVPLFGLQEGSHELLVLVTANDGRQFEMPTRIEVEAAGTVDGGLPVINRHYRAWLEQRAEHLDRTAIDPAHPESRLSFDVIVPLEGDCEAALEAIVASMEAQTDPRWHLTLVDSGNAGDEAREFARHLARQERRMSYREANGDGAVAGLNAALTESSADWVGILPPGLILAPYSLATISRALASQPDARVAYTDDDRIDPESMERWNPFFKPDWAPDLLWSMNYLAPLTLFHRETAIQVGGLRHDFPSGEVYDLALRVTEQFGQVHHVPEVLVTSITTAPGPGEPWHASNWQEAECRALEDALARRGLDGSVERGIHPGTWRVRYRWPETPGVTVVIPTGGKLDMLRPCLTDLLERTDYPNLDILLVDNSGGDAVERLVAELSPRHPHVRRLANPLRPFNYSALVNSALPHVTTPFVLMLNDDITVIDPDWLGAMVEIGQRPDVGIVGAKLLYPDDTIQHAGVVLGPFGGSVHVFKRLPGDDPGFFDLPDVVRNISAVTFACALIDRSVFEAIGGLDEVNLPVAFNDTDFCLRTREAGYEVIYTPFARLHHHESVTKVVIAHPHEIDFLRERWGHVIDHDPYYNPNLTRQGEDARLNMEASGAA
ncbi:MAG: glycosyltransferase family 2 protein [Chloroflexi bacterium]|nr:glycosyltransferase family 2 protein [Chloroflexota bacterium]